jgi:hypothetical protein
VSRAVPEGRNLGGTFAENLDDVTSLLRSLD